MCFAPSSIQWSWTEFSFKYSKYLQSSICKIPQLCSFSARVKVLLDILKTSQIEIKQTSSSRKPIASSTVQNRHTPAPLILLHVSPPSLPLYCQHSSFSISPSTVLLPPCLYFFLSFRADFEPGWVLKSLNRKPFILQRKRLKQELAASYTSRQAKTMALPLRRKMRLFMA